MIRGKSGFFLSGKNHENHHAWGKHEAVRVCPESLISLAAVDPGSFFRQVPFIERLGRKASPLISADRLRT